ncbi:MAG: alpha/beta fold hydrolase [Candidatus Heimdallarchaeota archaeon]
MRKYYNISKWIVAGHSWGAIIVLAYSLFHRSNVEGIIYLAGIGVQNNREWHSQFQHNKSKYPDPLPKMKFPFNEEVNKEGNKSWRDYIQNPMIRKNISELNIPTLILQGQNDIRPNWPAKQLSKVLPKAIYKEIDNAVHCILLTHPDELRKEIRAFINSFNSIN